MIIQTSNIKLNVEIFPSTEKDTAFVFLLHGFTGSSADWFEIIPHLNPQFSYAAIDLIGHGKSESPENVNLYATNSIVQQLDEVFEHLKKKKFILIGYSMGGRAALSYAVRYPEKLIGLVLESTSAGISNEQMREERRQSDAKIIKMIEEKSFEEFIDYWINQDLFATQRNLPQRMALQNQKPADGVLGIKVKSQKIGLINSLKGFGTGVMPALNDKLHLINCKTLLITGGLDKKFTHLNAELVNSFSSAEHIVVKNAGHNVHLEILEEYIKLLNEHLMRNY